MDILMDIYNYFNKQEENSEVVEISSINAKEAYNEALHVQEVRAEEEIDEIFQKIRQEAQKGNFFCYIDQINKRNQEVLSNLLGYSLLRVTDLKCGANIWKISWEEPKDD